MLLKEHRFVFEAEPNTHVFKVEELIKELGLWPHRFRLKLAACSMWGAQTFYGSSCAEVAGAAVNYMASILNPSLQPGSRIRRPTRL